MDDPWPRNSGNTNIAFNGQKMQMAIERYRNNKVTPPTDPTTLDIMQAGRSRDDDGERGAAAGHATNPTTDSMSRVRVMRV